MKKFFLIMLLAQVCCAQYIDVTPDGLQGYAEFKTDGNAHAATLDYLTRNHRPEAIKGSTVGNWLQLDCYADAAVTAKGGIFKEPFNVRYSIFFEFSDTTVKVYFKDVEFRQTRRTNVEYQLAYQGGGIFAIYDKAGKLKSAQTKLSIEMFFNNQINRLKSDLWK